MHICISKYDLIEKVYMYVCSLKCTYKYVCKYATNFTPAWSSASSYLTQPIYALAGQHTYMFTLTHTHLH